MAKLKISVLPIDTIIDELKYVLVKREEHKVALNKIMTKHPDNYSKYLVYYEHLNQYRRLNKEVETITDEIKRRLKAHDKT